MRIVAVLGAALWMAAASAFAQSPRTRLFTSSHDLIGNADLSGGVAVVRPGTDTPRAPRDRLSTAEASLRLPGTTSSIATANLVRPDVTVDSSDAEFTAAPITNGSPPQAADDPGRVWRSQNTALQHFVDLAFHDAPRDVSSLAVTWGLAGGPARWKIQVAGADGWLVDAIDWQDATGDPSSSVDFTPAIATRRIRVIQDEGGGPASAPNLMTVAELSVTTAGAPLVHAVTVDSSYLDYAPSFIADGDTRVGTTAAFWTEVWASADSAATHWVEVDLGEPHLVAQADVHWGAWGSARFKIQYWNGSAFEDTSSSVGTWLDDGYSQSVSHVQFAPVTTSRMRVLQDANGGIPPAGDFRTGLMSVAELELHSAQSWLLSSSADSSYLDYSPSALIDGVHTSTCPLSACDGPGQLWVSAETAVEHSVELRLAERMYVGSLRIDWGAWGSTAFTVSSWNGSVWVDHLSGSVGSNGLVVAPIDVITDRLRIAQPAGAGSGRPADGFVRPDLMSIGEVILRNTPALLASSADSSYGGYSPSALIDGAVTASCAPSACDGPGELWVSAETPAEHWVELELGQWMYVGALRIDWGAWGSTAFTVRSWNGSAWVDHFGGSASSNGLVEAPIGAYTDRLRIVQPAGAGAGRPADGFVRPNLMSIGELTLWGYRGTARYVSAPIRMSDPIAQVTLTATQSGVGSGQSASYAISSDDGTTWTAVTPGVAATPPPGDRLRWRVDLAGQGVGTPEIESVTLALTGQPREIAPALWRSGRSGAISVGVDDSQPTLLTPPLNQLNDAFFKGTSFVCFMNAGCFWEIPAFSLAHELASHTISHGCADSPPDGSQTNSLLAEFTQQQDILDAALSERGRVQSLAWPCGNYDLAKGSLARRFFVSARGFRDGDPDQHPLCQPGFLWNCALPEGESMELVEEPTPRNFMNLKALAADHWRLPEFAPPDAIDWVENQGDWAVLAYHYFSETGPYQGEIGAMVGRDVWVAPQGEVARYVKLRDSFASETVGSSPTSRDFRVWTLLSLSDVPEFSHAPAAYPLGEVVERVFDGGVTARVHSPDPLLAPQRALIWGNGVPHTTRDVEGNPYLLFDTPLTPYPTPIHVDWVAAGDADGDGVSNASDNCVHRANADKADIAGVATATPNLVGDRCECGDVSNDGGVDANDVAQLRAELVAPGSLGAEGAAKCSVIDVAAPTCDVADLVVLRRRLQSRPLLPGTFPVCTAARP